MYIFTVFMLASGLSLSSTFVMKGVSSAIGALDTPNEKRKMHEKIIPRGAGVSMFFAFALAFLFSLFLHRDSLSFLSGAILSGGALIVGIGLSDDVFSLGAKMKLVSQIAVSFVPISFGIRIGSLSVGSAVLTLPPFLSFVFSLAFIVFLTNAFNLIDGLDGLAAGVALLALAPLFLSGAGEDHSFLCAALFGAILGFLPYNKHKASIFMGDSGSLFLGYAISLLVIALKGDSENAANGGFTLPILPVLLILLYPICDTSFAILRRLKKRKSIFEADANHIHHRLLRMGLSHERAVLILLLSSFIFATLGTLLL
jgi:UDP-GlcNAc:undecaprenyl-phosphate GlcNAc-1-phosphate transferase